MTTVLKAGIAVLKRPNSISERLLVGVGSKIRGQAILQVCRSCEGERAMRCLKLRSSNTRQVSQARQSGVKSGLCFASQKQERDAYAK